MKTLLGFAAAGLVVLAGGSPVPAQYFHGHVHYHHGHIDYHGHWHYPGYSGYAYPYASGSYSDPRYYPSVATYPVVQPATTVVPVAGVTTATSLKPNALPPYAGPGVTLRLPAEFPNPVYVTADKREVELKPGIEVVLKDKASCVVEFDRGGDFGAARQELTEGAYKLVVGEKGWQVAPDAPATGGLRPNPLPLPVERK